MTDQTRLNREAYPHFVTQQTRWNDNDIYGHLNNAQYFPLMDSAVNEWLIAKGLLDLRTSTQIFVVAETGFRYFKELVYPDPVFTGIRVAKLGNSSVVYDVGMFDADAKIANAVGRLVHVYVDRETHRPVHLNDRQREVLSALMR